MPIILHPAARRGGRRRLSEGGSIPVPLGVGPSPGPGRADLAARLACPPGLLDQAEAAVESACRAVFDPDPLLGPLFSHVTSVPSSMVKRHGLLIETAIAATLEHSGHYVVHRNVAMPIVAPTQELLLACTREELVGRSMGLRGEIVQTVLLDLVAIDLRTRRAFIAEVKRGGAKSEARKVAQVEWVMRAAQLQGSAYLASLNYPVADTRAVLIDVYGRAGFSADLTVTGQEMDTLFGVPVMAVIDAMTAAMRERLQAVMPDLLRAVLPSAGKVEPLRAPAAL